MVSRHLPSCTPRDVERALIRIGFFEERQHGSHKVFIRLSDQRTVVLAWHNRDLKKGTLRGIIRSVGMDPETFVDLL